MPAKIALITGAGGGLGTELSRQLAAADFAVHASDLTLDHTAHLHDEDRIHRLAIDVTDDDSVLAGVASIIERAGPIDLLVNNAAMPQIGAIEAVPSDTLRLLFDINVIGYGRMLRAVLPSMRARRSGHVINISSGNGQRPLAGFGWYSATKHAVEGLSDALRMEVGRFGIAVTIIEPGLIATPFVDKQRNGLDGVEHIADYDALMAAGARIGAAGEGASPAEIATAIVEAANAEHPPTRLVVPESHAASHRKYLLLDDREKDAVSLGILGLAPTTG